MHKRLRVFAVVGIVLLIAAACSKPRDEASQVGGKSKGASALEGPVSGGSEKTAGGGKKAITVQEIGEGAKGYSALNPSADVEQAKKIGRLIRLRSTSYSNPATWAGVTKNTIKLAFNIDKTNCGVNLFQLLSNAGANFAPGTRYTRPAPTDPDSSLKDNQEAVSNLIRYWNDHVGDVADDIPQATQVMKKYNTAGHNFYGRKLIYQFVDGGSFQCPDRTTAAAVQLANTIKPFSVVTYDLPGLNQTGYNMSAALKAKAPASSRPMHFGMIDATDKHLNSWAPYTWAEFQSVTKMSQLSASWICSRLNGKNATNSPQYKGTKRKFGLLYPNNPTAKQAAVDFKAAVKANCGKNIIDPDNEVVFNDNPARAADEGTSIMVKMKLNGVTSVIYLIDFLGAFFHVEDAYAQDYHPEFNWIGTAMQTSDAQRLFVHQEMLDKASMGYTAFGIQGFGYGPGDPFWTWHTYHKVSPKTHKACDPRSDAGMMHDPSYCRQPYNDAGWYYSWLPLIGGFIFAGPNLTPGNVSAGLQAYPLTRYGTDGPTTDPQAVLVGAGPGQYYFITDGSEYRWRAGYVSPPPQQLLGWAEYPDCQRHYVKWPSQLANAWQKGGPNYNAYCGDAKYANFDYKPKEGACSDAPSGKCEKDGYPRWTQVIYR